MATIARRAVQAGLEEAWELPRNRPILVRAAEPWLRNPAGLLGLIIVVMFIVLGIIGPYVAPYDPRALDASSRYLGPSMEHPFGTNSLGQDMFSRLLYGTRVSFMFGFSIMIVGFLPGTILGLLSGYFGRWVDYAIQRSGEAWSSFPQLPILLTVIAAVGPGLKGILIVIAISAVFGGSRLLRAVALLEKHKEYILAARSTGASEFHLLLRHIVPNVMPFILVGLSSIFAVAILAEAALSFLGLGLEPGTPGWGIDLSVGVNKGGAEHPYLVIFPGAVISIVVLAFNLLGDTLRDILDPRLRGSTGAKR